MLTFTLAAMLAVAFVSTSYAQEDVQAKIAGATGAAPATISDNATVADWPSEPGGELTILREGTNGWTCLPDTPDSAGYDPMCLDEPWLVWADAWINKTEPEITRIGLGYMLQGGAAQSNTDPYAEGPTDDNEWMEKGVPHLMILVPDESMLEGLPVHPDQGGPWVMWRDTPYVHIMAPMPKHDTGM